MAMFDPDSIPPSAVDTVAHVIQIALTPVFLLSGIASLLGVFSGRLARVADRVDHLSQSLETADAALAKRLDLQLTRLRRRSMALDVAVVLGTMAGAATCSAALTLFLGAVRDKTAAGLLYLSFGMALLCTILALSAFLVEMLMASGSVRSDVAAHRSEVEGGADAGEPGSEPRPVNAPDGVDTAKE